MTLFIDAWPEPSALAADQIGNRSLQVVDSAAQPLKVYLVRRVLPGVIMAVSQGSGIGHHHGREALPPEGPVVRAPCTREMRGQHHGTVRQGRLLQRPG